MKLGLGDHDLISAIRKQNTTRPQPKLIEHRSMKGFDNDRFLADIGKIPGILHISSMTLMIFVNTGTSCGDAIQKEVHPGRPAALNNP